jgi:NAD(P)-dependent dehydrogenase (short-subunit alcohol dehydrogenase family)
MPSLTGKTVLLTGASRGIGAETARALGASGARVIAHYGSHREGAEQAVAAIPAERKLLLQADFAKPGAARALWAEALAQCGRIDVVIANAAVMPNTALDASDDEWDAGWDEALRVNVLEPASLIREAVLHFVAHGGGSLIALSSWAAQRGSAIAQLGGYAASKAAIKNLTQTIARNYASDGVLAYIVAPGIVRTRMSEISASSRGGLDAVNAALTLGEMVPPEEVARVIVFLAGGDCRHLTGSTIDINGASYIR